MQKVRVTILVAPGFVPTEFALAQDTLRIANRLSGRPIFAAKICSINADTLIEGMSGMMVRATPFQLEASDLPDHLVVLGGTGILAEFCHLRARLGWVERMGGDILLLSDAASVWKRLHPDTHHVTTHWEIDQRERDASHLDQVDLPLFTCNSRIATGAGMTSTADVVLTRIVSPQSLHLAESVAQVLLMGGIREGTVHQPRSENDVMTLRHARLEPIIAAMESAVENPLTMEQLAATAGFSVRQMERKFKTLVGQSPSAFYRSLRLRRAKTLIEQTILPISEILLACGFGSNSNFAKKYAQEFGVSPSKQRLLLSRASRPLQRTSDQQGPSHAPISLSPSVSRSFVDTSGTDETFVRIAGCERYLNRASYCL